MYYYPSIELAILWEKQQNKGTSDKQEQTEEEKKQRIL